MVLCSPNLLIFTDYFFIINSLLLLGPEGQVPCIAESGHNVSLGSEFFIDVTTPDGYLRLFPPNVFNTNGAGNGADHMNGFWHAFILKVLDGFDEGGTGGQHGVTEDERAIRKVRAGDIIQADLKATVPMVFTIGRDECVVCLIEIVQHSLVERHAGTQDRTENGLFLKDLTNGSAQGRLDLFLSKRQGFADLIGGDLADPFQVTAEAHAILLNTEVPDLADPGIYQ